MESAQARLLIGCSGCYPESLRTDAEGVKCGARHIWRGTSVMSSYNPVCPRILDDHAHRRTETRPHPRAPRRDPRSAGRVCRPPRRGHRHGAGGLSLPRRDRRGHGQPLFHEPHGLVRREGHPARRAEAPAPGAGGAPPVPRGGEPRARGHLRRDLARRRRWRARGDAQPHRQRPRAPQAPAGVVRQPQSKEEDPIKHRILGALALALTLAAAPIAGAQTQLKWAHVYETSEPYHQQALWAAGEIAKRTNGRYRIDVFPASTLGKETDINQALSLGTVDIIYTGMAFAGRIYPPMSIASGPFIFRDYNHWQAFRNGPEFREVARGYEDT